MAAVHRPYRKIAVEQLRASILPVRKTGHVLNQLTVLTAPFTCLALLLVREMGDLFNKQEAKSRLKNRAQGNRWNGVTATLH